jgi:hypothetical protein
MIKNGYTYKEIIIRKNIKNYVVVQIEFKYYSSSNYKDYSDDILDRYLTLFVTKEYSNKIKYYKINKKFNNTLINKIINDIESYKDLYYQEFEKIFFNYDR